MKRLFKRLGLALFLLVLLLIARPAWHLGMTAWNDPDSPVPPPAEGLTDASRMETAPVNEWHLPVAASLEEAEASLREALARARDTHRSVTLGGARHSMGGHTLRDQALHIHLQHLNHIQYDADQQTLRVGAGARWAEILPILDQHGRSVAVMQSNNSFSVGGSLSANCHGWAFPCAPIASTVRQFRLMLANGEVRVCSRTQNEDLFQAALGGYGLMGIITEAVLTTVPNHLLVRERWVLSIQDAFATYQEHIENDPTVELAYGRFDVSEEHFLKRLVVTAWRNEGAPPNTPLQTPRLRGLRRAVFRGSVGSDYGKRLRWVAETKIQPHAASDQQTRNNLLNESVTVFANHDPHATDILHEYFLPEDSVPAFLDHVRSGVRNHQVDLLNVTIRRVETDDDTLLRYADRPLFALVMLFHQKRTEAAEQSMRSCTRELIAAALDLDGRYYLPYRPHATLEQFHQAYPAAETFRQIKSRVDPESLFRNRFFDRYLATPPAGETGSPQP